MKFLQSTTLHASFSKLIAFVSFCLCASIANAQVAGMGTGTDAVQSATITGFTAPAGTNRVLIVTVSDALTTNILTATFNGTAMIERAERNDGIAVDAIYTLSLGTSASSTTGNIVVTSGDPSATGKYITARVYQNVNQSTPLSGIQSGFGGPSTTTFNIASTTNDLVIDIMDTYNGTTTGTRAIGSGQTSVHNSPPIDVGGYAFYGTTTKPGAASVAMAWTTSHLSFIHIAANIQQAAAALPITLVSFDAALLQNNVTLNWKVSDAVNFSYFDVEKSLDGTNFTKLAKIPFASTDQTYDFTDNNVTGDQVYYRLRMTDIDNSSRFSKTVPVYLTKPKNVHLYILQPNPFVNVLNTNVYMPQSEQVTFTINDMAGRAVYSKQVIMPKGVSSQSIDGLQQLQKGIYLFQIHHNKGVISRKVVKQ